MVERAEHHKALKLTGGFLGLRWTADSRKFTEVFTLLLLALPVPDSYHCCYRKDSLHSALAEDLSVMSQPQLNHTMLLHIMYAYSYMGDCGGGLAWTHMLMHIHMHNVHMHALTCITTKTPLSD